MTQMQIMGGRGVKLSQVFADIGELLDGRHQGDVVTVDYEQLALWQESIESICNNFDLDIVGNCPVAHLRGWTNIGRISRGDKP